MTEYDYSPDAIERHLAKQAAIANWVDRTKQHEPANPFVKLPDECARQHPQPKQPQQAYSQAAFHTTPQGLNSPAYSSARASTSSKKNKSGSHRTSSRHSSSSHGLHSSSTSTTLPNSRPPPPQTTSYFISPPTSPNGPSYLMPQTGQLPSLMPSASVVQQHPYPLPAGFSTLAIQPTPNQPVVVPINGGIGGYVVVPAQGVTIVVSVDIKFHWWWGHTRSELCPPPASLLSLFCLSLS